MYLHTLYTKLAVHLLAAVSWPRQSETEPKWFVFETCCYAFAGQNELNKAND